MRAAPTASARTTARPAIREIRSFDGLRGLAALLVVVYHFTPLRSDATMSSRALERCTTMVDLFFVLSGFVMSLTYGGLFAERVTLPSLRLFLARRIARIYPLYLLVTLAIALLVATGHSGRAPRDTLGPIVLSNVLLVQSSIGAPSLDFPSWSISTEWAAYLLFPLLVPLVLRRSPAGRVVAVASAAFAATALVEFDGGLAPATIGRGGGGFAEAIGATVQCLADFTLGMVAFRASRTKFGARLAASGVSAIPILLVLLLLFASPARPLFTALAIGLFPALLLSLAADRGPVAALLASPVAVRLGAWSYAVYLLHPALIGPRLRLASLLARHAAPQAGLTASALSIAMLLPLAAATYGLVELPTRRMVRGWIEHGEFRPQRAPSN